MLTVFLAELSSLKLVTALKLYFDIKCCTVEKWRRVFTIKNEFSRIVRICSVYKEKENADVIFIMLIAESFPHEALDIISEWDKVDLDVETGHVLFQLLQLCVRSGLEKDWGQQSFSLLSELSSSSKTKDVDYRCRNDSDHQQSA